MGGLRPKTLLPIIEGRAVLDYILEALDAAGLKDLVVVTGFRADEVEAHVGATWKGGVEFVRNARFASWGNFHSVRVALERVPGSDVLVVNSDVIVPPDVLRRVSQTAGDVVLAVERKLNLDHEDMKVRLDRDRVLGIGKALPRAHSHGEFAGVSLVRAGVARLYCDVCNGLEWRARTGVYYEDVYALMVGRCDVRAASVQPGEYAEIDVPEDVPAAAAVAARVAQPDARTHA